MDGPLYQDLPDLGSGVLAELGGWPVLREARALAASGAVKSVEWEKPILRASLQVGGQSFALSLNLRSTAFAENHCNCERGRRGYVCAHALAACIEIVRLKELSEKGASDKRPRVAAPAKPSPPPEPAKAVPGALRSFDLDGAGQLMYCRFILPPNLPAAALRNMVMVKLELIVQGRRNPPERIFRGCKYRLDPQTLKALLLVEEWAAGKLSGILQLKREQLAALIETLRGTPCFEWAGKAEVPITWVGDALTGVSGHVETAKPPQTASQDSGKCAEESTEIKVRRSGGVITRPTQSVLDFHPAPVPREERLRREAEDEGKMLVDGSPHFLSIRIPTGDYPLRERAARLFEQSGFRLEPSNARWWLRDRHKVLNFLAEHGEEFGRVYAPQYTDNYRERMAAVHRAKIRAKAEAEKGGSFMLDMRIQAGPLGEQDIRRAMASRQFYVISGDSIWLLPPTLLERMAAAQCALSGHPGQAPLPSMRRRVDAARICDADNLLKELEAEVETPAQWKARSEALKNFSALHPAPVPAALDERLRSYQRIGAAWLWQLFRSGLGGVLADEMGLGKTVQAVALLAALRGSGESAPALVVCPAGLVENWMRECARFAPQLRVQRHHGATRIASLDVALGADIIISSYQTLVRDSDLFTSLELSLIIADEAQHIKNRRTQAAAALRSLHAGARFVLTGTPVENSLDDLRSIFSFILPGYLPAIPEGMKGEDRAWYDRRHLQQAAPYILRRSKKLVAPELPEKIEQTLYCELSPAQERLYKELREQGQKAIFDLEMSGASEGRLRMEALTRLLRLRQTCTDPRLLRPEMDAVDSAKLKALEEILEEAIDGGHRLLVFSQFVEALKLIADMLREKELSFCYIDGSTQNRQKECDRFNGDESIPVFLISLKAGGTGLNLTGADTVVHFDPWWNPAVEAQATDRAHRIGQTRTVTSIKLIATGTVEEKVLEMQREKAALLRELLDESAVQTSKVSLKDLRDLIG